MLERLTLVWVLAAAGCAIDPFTFQPGKPDGGVIGGPDGSGDAGTPDAEETCTPIGPDDQCDEIDNDCNGVVDDAFDKQNDPNHCGMCGNRCVLPNAVMACEMGNCVFIECQLGYADLDPSAPGCEYRCPVFPPAGEECNGVDEDCDGQIDEAADLPPPPTGQCRDVPGTPCEGTTMVCETRGGVTTWYCDYGPGVEFDPSVPNGIFLEETRCDGVDGDCDGAADEPFADLGQECDNGLLGACRDVGRRVCDPMDPSRTTCDLSVPPDPVPGAPAAETCNGIDDNCDGIVDNPTGPERVIDDMVEIDRGGLDFWIYRYEASRPDATGTSQGTLAHRSCSQPGVLPWTQVTYDTAQAACAAAGKRLCTAEEYSAACGGPSGTAYPYGDVYDGLACNGVDYDTLDTLRPTGIATCTGPDGIFDMSGNAKEWTDDVRGDTGAPDFTPIVVVRGGAYDTPRKGLRCDFELSRAAADVVLPTLGFRCCSDVGP